MKIETLLNSTAALQELAQLKFKNGAVSFRVGKLLKEVEPLVNLAMDKQRELYEELKDKPDEFKKALEPILKEEIELKIPDIKLSDFQHGDDWLELAPASYAVLDWLIVDDLD